MPVHVSGLLVAHHQEAAVLYGLVDCRWAWLEWNRLTRSMPARPSDGRLRYTTCTNRHICPLLPPDDGLLANLEHLEA
jgi:hypothetical protein